MHQRQPDDSIIQPRADEKHRQGQCQQRQGKGAGQQNQQAKQVLASEIKPR